LRGDVHVNTKPDHSSGDPTGEIEIDVVSVGLCVEDLHSIGRTSCTTFPIIIEIVDIRSTGAII